MNTTTTKTLPTRSEIKIGGVVFFELKSNRGSFSTGIVEKILTNHEAHPYGIMVKVQDGKIGRVKMILPPNFVPAEEMGVIV
jgi:uncharacterized repeat protein (TIGR03833 family)|tara:strand:+ start:271 stop:516 length:246 start_codon:yes stop_codon:yes gene_type:complete